MPDSEESLRQIEVHQRRWRNASATDVAFAERMIEWRESAKGNLWTRVYMGSIVTRITIFPSRYRTGEFGFVWSREGGTDGSFGEFGEIEKHFNRTRGLTSI